MNFLLARELGLTYIYATSQQFSTIEKRKQEKMERQYGE